jgi:glutathione S-transferase
MGSVYTLYIRKPVLESSSSKDTLYLSWELSVSLEQYSSRYQSCPVSTLRKNSKETIMNVDKELFGVFAFHAGLMAVKTLGMSFLTARQRFANNNFISKEDGKGRTGVKIGLNQVEDVERVRRAHQNDIENIFPFLSLGFLYLFTNPALATATTVFRIFSGARIFHSIVYLWEVPQPSRALTFFVGMGVNLYMGYKILTTFASSM